MKHLFLQHDTADCGPTCLKMITWHYGKQFSIKLLRKYCRCSRSGTSFGNLREAAIRIGMKAYGYQITFNELLETRKIPCIAHWAQNHFVVIYEIKQKKGKTHIYVADPAKGKCVYEKEDFFKAWCAVENQQGFILHLTPTYKFYSNHLEAPPQTNRWIWRGILQPLLPYGGRIGVIIILLILLGSFQFWLPFLTQTLVDKGISKSNIYVVNLIIIAQVVLLTSRLLLDFLRSWLMLNVSYNVGIELSFRYLKKLTLLPLYFFETRSVGDIIQRIKDNGRVQLFITNTSAEFIFSLFTFVTFSIVLFYYDSIFFFLFIGGNLLCSSWNLLFMKYRKKIDNSRFETGISEQNKLYQLVMGMRDIKLNNCETERCHEWREIQNRLYLIEKRKQFLERLQQSGMQFFSQMSNILIGYIAACSVVDRQITLGEMMSIMFVVGNLSIPIERLVEFIHKWQDAKISIDRLEEVYQYTNEKELPFVGENVIEGDIVLDAVSFSYGKSLKKALNNISLRVPSGKVVAIVGTSGSGKTTLLKLIMGYYPPSQGKISVGNLDISNIPPLLWRKQLGTVLQDGYIFSDTIAKNIAMKGEIDKKRLNKAIDISCLKTFVSSLPMGVNTIIGSEGDGLSQGQIQRILIARMIYANSNYILLDEATNSLDASNERLLLSNLRHFYKDRTVIVVAHRLSTIKKADKIIVLENGKIAEVGTHEELIRDKGKYYALVKDQLI